MTETNIEISKSKTDENTKEGVVRKPYSKPLVEEMGDLRDLTLGPTPGAGESGNPLLYRSGL